MGLGSSPFARHYLGNHYLFSLPRGNKMFQFPPLAPCYCRVTVLQTARLSHSEIRGSMVICTYPQLIAAYHVLHRLCEPRHPPCALSYFISHLTSFSPSIKSEEQRLVAHTFSCIEIVHAYYLQLLAALSATKIVIFTVLLVSICQRSFALNLF